MTYEPDMHVEVLKYKLLGGKTITFDHPEPIKFETDDAFFRLDDGVLHVSMKKHFSAPTEARSVVDPVLKAWEVFAELEENTAGFRFEYDTADMIDRSPPVKGQIRGHIIQAQGIQSQEAFGTVTIQQSMTHYPNPPTYFRLNPDAESLWLRYVSYCNGREPLQSMAYFCLTVLQAISGDRKAASRKYRIRQDFLNKIGELSSNRSDGLWARKAMRKQRKDLGGKERAWLAAAIKKLILRVGSEVNTDRLPWITMSGLPI